MTFYRAYDLKFDSELLLPEIKEVCNKEKVDVTIRCESLNTPKLESTLTNCHCKITEEEAYLAWKQVGTFLVRGGQEIIVDLIPNVEESVVRLFLLGAGLGMLLYQRGLFVLHASSIALDGHGIAFIGDKGWGKSTTAGMLHKRGHKLFADDVTALDLSKPDRPMLLPGYSQLKLWPESAEALGQKTEDLSRLHPQLEKRDFQPENSLVATAQPLKQLYLLGSGETLAIEPLSGQNALSALMQNWYCARFGPQMFDIVDQGQHFLNCTRLLKQAPIFHLKRERSLAALSDIASLVETHVKQGSAVMSPVN